MIVRDATTGLLSLVAPARSLRPTPRKHGHLVDLGTQACPFCGDLHPDAVATAGQDDSWTLQIIPNAFPVLTAAEGGRHEVVVEDSAHDGDWTDPEVHTRSLLAVAKRIGELEATPGVRCVLWFRNVGYLAGASLTHPHSQLLALPQVPAVVANITRAGRQGLASGSGSAWQALEQAAGGDVVWDDEQVSVVAPAAPQTTGEVWVVPKDGRSSISGAGRGTLEAVAASLHRITCGVWGSTGPVDHNVVLHSLPASEGEGLQWHLRWLPRRGIPAGLELATGCQVVTEAATQTSARLRDGWRAWAQGLQKSGT